MPDALRAAALLLASNTFMTLAWYGHLRLRSVPMLLAILGSWGIAFFEYVLQVPANRIGYRTLSAYQLKVMQEVISLAVFVVFAWIALGEPLRGKHAVAFGLILGAVVIAFR